MVVYRRKGVVKPDEMDKIATNKESGDEFSDVSSDDEGGSIRQKKGFISGGENLNLRFDVFELLEMKLPVPQVNTTNEQKLVPGQETAPLRVKGDIKDLSSELDNGDEMLHFLDETPRILLLSAS
ncbi:hypothetical protein TNCV_3488811 [Trichonephila clavipes]|nr:hypothetical protein TNCV_3488811 [Trichonephila clavipes]